MSTSEVGFPASANNQEIANNFNVGKNNDQLLVETLLSTDNLSVKNNTEDTVNVDLNQLYKSLTVLSRKVLDKLDEVIGKDTPGGVYNLKPEDHTPEKTAETIVSGTTALFGVFASQHKDLQGEELLTEFMKTIRSGIQKGYKDAENILGDIGAFEIDGVQSGIAETKKLVEEKLKAFEDNYRKQNGLAVEEKAAKNTESAVLQQASISAVA